MSNSFILHKDASYRNKKHNYSINDSSIVYFT